MNSVISVSGHIFTYLYLYPVLIHIYFLVIPDCLLKYDRYTPGHETTQPYCYLSSYPNLNHHNNHHLYLQPSTYLFHLLYILLL